jgi:hypothetical protein
MDAISRLRLHNYFTATETFTLVKFKLRISAHLRRVKRNAIISVGDRNSKLGFDRPFGFDFGLSGVTPGNRGEVAFRRMSVTARLRRLAHAR